MLPQIPPDVQPWAYYTCVSLAVLITAASKAGFGGGIGILSVPLTIMVLPPAQALGLMLPILIVSDLAAYYHHPTGQAKRHLRWLIAGCFIGIVIATALLITLGFAMRQRPESFSRALSLVIGLICAMMVIANVYRMFGGKVGRLPHTPFVGYTTGTLAGIFSTLAQSAGPITNIYLLEMGFDKSVHVSTSVLYYLFGNCAKVPFYLALTVMFPDQPYFTWKNLWASILFMPIVPVGSVLGAWMHRKLDERPFMIVMYAGTLLAAVWMIYKAVA